MTTTNDQQLLSAMAALQYRMSALGVPHLIPIPGHRGNVGTLRYISLPGDAATSTLLGVASHALVGLVAGFEINEDEQVAPARRSSALLYISNGYATHDGRE